MGKREETESKILDAAISLIAEKGYSSTKTLEIANLAGTSEATLFKYFSNKKGLLMSIVNRAIKIFGERIVLKPIINILEAGESLPFEEVLDQIIADRLEMMIKQKAVITVLINEIQFHDEVRQSVIDEIYKPVSDAFATFYWKQTELGHVRKVDYPEHILKMFIALFLQPIVTFIISGESVDTDVLNQMYMEIKEFMVRGVKP